MYKDTIILSPLSMLKALDVQKALIDMHVVVQDPPALQHPSSNSYWYYPRSTPPLKQKVWSKCLVLKNKKKISYLKSMCRKKKMSFGISQKARISLAVKNSDLCRARLSSSSSFPCFSSHYFQAFLLSPPAWCEPRCNWEPYLHIWLA